MKTLVSVIKKSEAATWMQLEKELRSAIRVLKECKSEVLMGRTKISLGSGCDLFMKYVTRAFLEFTVIVHYHSPHYHSNKISGI
jgi:translation initiation factor eIF-2B subunit alpha